MLPEHEKIRDEIRNSWSEAERLRRKVYKRLDKINDKKYDSPSESSVNSDTQYHGKFYH